MLSRAFRWLRAMGTLALVVLFGVALWQQSRGNIMARIYRQRLQNLTAQYSQLRDMYNQIVRKTAVTELDLSDGRLSVVVRTAEGIVQRIPTGLDPNQEVHVDYLVQDGRLWIRRVYTLPEPDQAGHSGANVVTINPALAQPPWSTDPNLRGVGVYRKHLTPGRWVVTTTGNGALGLKKLPPGQDCQLASPPPVRDFAEVDRQVHDEVSRLGVMDIARNIFAEP